MKILIFDDSENHRKAAAALLKGHDLTIVGTYDEANKALTNQIDHGRMKEVFAEKYGDTEPYKQCSDDAIRKERMNYFNGEAKRKATTLPDYDVVLTDLLVPASSNAQGPDGRPFVGKEMPLGTVIALRALAAGVKRVAVVTDMNHHNHPASAALDDFPAFSVGDTRILCTNRDVTTHLDAETLEKIDYDFLRTPRVRRSIRSSRTTPIKASSSPRRGIGCSASCSKRSNRKAKLDRLVATLETQVTIERTSFELCALSFI